MSNSGLHPPPLSELLPPSADIYLGQETYDSFVEGGIIERYATVGIRIKLCTYLQPELAVGVTEVGRREVREWEKCLKKEIDKDGR